LKITPRMNHFIEERKQTVTGKNKHHGSEKEGKKSKMDDHSGIDVVIGDPQEGKPTGEGKPEEEGGKALSPLEKLQTQLEEKTRESAEYFDKWIRLQAEFENYKKRIQREKTDQMKFGNETILRAILPIIDNLERAIDHGKQAKEAGPLIAGVEITLNQFLNILEKFGVKPVPAVGEVFDPEKHEAISQIQSDQESNRVVSEAQKGYLFHERLLRPAKVIVSKSKSEAEEEKKAGA
jgi:molecular chaperone GrpE